MSHAQETLVRIRDAATAIGGKNLPSKASALLGAIGYASPKTLAIDTSPTAFLADLGIDTAKFGELLPRIAAVHFMFQLTGDELPALSRNTEPQTGASFQRGAIDSFVFLAVDLDDQPWSRRELVTIVREINRGFAMPAIILFRHGGNQPAAAANYARTACEMGLRRYCRNHAIPFGYADEPQKIKLEDLLKKAEAHAKGDADREAAFTEIKKYKKLILNPLSHNPTQPIVKADVQANEFPADRFNLHIGSAAALGRIDAFIDLPQDVHRLLTSRGQCNAGIDAEFHALLIKAISKLDGEDLLPLRRNPNAHAGAQEVMDLIALRIWFQSFERLVGQGLYGHVSSFR